MSLGSTSFKGAIFESLRPNCLFSNAEAGKTHGVPPERGHEIHSITAAPFASTCGHLCYEEGCQRPNNTRHEKADVACERGAGVDDQKVRGGCWVRRPNG